MSHRLVPIVVFVLFIAGVAQAQVLPGDSVESGIGSAVRNSRMKPLLGLSHDHQTSGDTDSYRPSAGPPPKSSKDPWKGIRSSEPIDRHRPY
jgi:hypothetical protein